MKVINLTVQIKIDEDKLREAYPDFNEDFGTVDDFISAIENSIQTEEPDTLEDLGYEVLIVNEGVLLPLIYRFQS